jgi:hypothetical protein
VACTEMKAGIPDSSAQAAGTYLSTTYLWVLT